MRYTLVDDRTRALAKQHYIRPGAVDMDCAYACSVFDARDRVALEELANANPRKPVRMANMGFVPHDVDEPADPPNK